MFERVNPEALQRCFLAWVSQVVAATGAQVIPIDGKCIKGSDDRNKKQSALHVVSVRASSHRLMLGLVLVENKTNEIKAIPSLLKLLDITGCIITIDAMGTQTEHCSADCVPRGRLHLESQSQPSHLMHPGESMV